MRCPYCEKLISNSSIVCPNCGKSLLANTKLNTLLQEEQIVSEEEKAQDAPVITEEKPKEVLEEAKVVQEEKRSEQPKQYKKRRFGKQTYRMFLLGLLFIIGLICMILLKVLKPEVVAGTINDIWSDKLLAVLNILLLTIPTTFLFLLGQLGWLLILIVCGVGIMSSLLLMIRTTKTKKMIALGIIALYVVLIIITLIINRGKL